jgi:inorganic pyrophosphatase/exopolyphosphatase
VGLIAQWQEQAVVVLGNESADLDSVMCALVHARVLQEVRIAMHSGKL